MDQHLDAIVGFILTYRYAVILPIAILEGPIITIIAAFLAAQGYFNLALIYVIVVVGDVLGDVMYYGIGRFGHRIARTKLARKIGIGEHHLERVSKHFEEHSGKTLLFGKWTHSMGVVVLTSAGFAKMPILKFVWYNFLGSLPKSALLMLIGYYVGFAFQKINSIIDKVSFLLAALIILGVIGYLVKKNYLDKKIKENEE